MAVARRGEIWWFRPDPVVGREQGRDRPALVVSTDELNTSRRQLVVVLPITRSNLPYFYRVPITSEQSGLPALSYIMCEQIRVISPERFLDDYPRGRVSRDVLAMVESRLRALLELPRRYSS